MTVHTPQRPLNTKSSNGLLLLSKDTSYVEGNNTSSNSLEGEADALQTHQQPKDEDMEECPPAVPVFDASVLLAKAPTRSPHLKSPHGLHNVSSIIILRSKYIYPSWLKKLSWF